MNNHDRAAAALQNWLLRHPDWPYNAYPYERTSPSDLARRLIADGVLADIQLATWLDRPDMQILTAIAEASLPWPQRRELQLLIDAIDLVAREQQRGHRGRAATVGVGVIALIALAASLRQ